MTTDWAENSVLLRQVARIQLVKSSFWERLRGSVDVGASYTSATELLQLEADGASATGDRGSRRRPRPARS